VEGDEGAARADIDLGDVGANRLMLDLDQADQVLGRLRQVAEAVDHFGGQTFDLVLPLRLIEPAIERHAHRQIWHVILRDHDRGIDGDLWRNLVARRGEAHFARLGRQNRLLQHRLIQFEPDFADVA